MIQPQLPKIMLVTDRREYGDASAVVTAAGTAARAGVDLIHVRERGLEDSDLLALVRRVKAEISGTPCRVVVNDRVDVAIAARADGVHLPARAYSAARVRSIVPENFVVGRSVHSEVEALDAAREGGCDYLVFGAVFPTTSKPEGHVPAGLDALRRVCSLVALPVLAIGGISAASVPEIARTGAAGIAAIGLFARADGGSLRGTVQRIREAFGGD
jgi:thiamine-phosphate pyrophosphorylase